MPPQIAVILIALGGPDSLDEVGPFMAAFMGKPAPQSIVNAVVERYKLIGNKSPLVDIVQTQAAALGLELGPQYPTYAGFRHSTPTIAQAYTAAVSEGADHIIALSLSPFETIVTTGSYKKAFENLRISADFLTFIPSFHDNHYFIQAWQNKILNETTVAERENGAFIFTSHSLPMSCITNGDPYKSQVEHAIHAVSSGSSLKSWFTGWQSKGARATEPWLEPDVESLLDSIAKTGQKQVVEVPIGFTCDHLETLYDIDIVHRKCAKKLGLSFKRIASLNTNPMFIHALADIIQMQTCAV